MENGRGEGLDHLVSVPVDLVYSGDIAFCYAVTGLSGAASCFPSPFTLVTKEHLHSHATYSTPHNWEQPGCQFAYRNPEQLYKSWAACSRYTRNGGIPAKNARYHLGVKAAPLIPFPEGIKDFLGTFAPFPLHTELGINGVFLVDHMVTVCRIGDNLATEAELEFLSDLLEHEAGLEDQEEQEQDIVTTPLLLARRQEETAVAVASAELNEVKGQLEDELGVMVREQSFRERLVAAAKGEEGREELEAVCRQEGHPYLMRKFREQTRNLSCHLHCLLTGIDWGIS